MAAVVSASGAAAAGASATSASTSSSATFRGRRRCHISPMIVSFFFVAATVLYRYGYSQVQDSATLHYGLLFHHSQRQQQQQQQQQQQLHSTTNARPTTMSTKASANIDSSSAQSLLSQPIRLDRCKIHKPSDEVLRRQYGSRQQLEGGAAAGGGGTIVTAYFRVRAKYVDSEYDKWMQNILSLKDPMVVFTQSDMVPVILQQRDANNTVIIEMDLSDLPIAQLRGTKDNSTEFWTYQLERKDMERRTHRTYQVFWVWLSKSWWVKQAIDLNFFRTEFFMWSDIGCFRRAMFNDKILIQHPEVAPPGSVMWMAHHAPNPPPHTLLFWNKVEEPQHFYHSGSQGAGSAVAWKSFHQQFAKTMDDFLDLDFFIGEDQVVLQSACLQNPKLCSYVPFDQVVDNHYFGLRYALHHGPGSAKTSDGQYKLWRPPGWDRS